VAVGGQPTTVLEALASSPGPRLGPLVQPSERQVLVLDSGVTWERLGALPPHATDFLRITYAPGGTSSSTGELMRHSGAEYGLLQSGELVLTLGFEEIHLTPGDSVSFESSTPHRYRNDGTEPAVGIWFVTD
jgi:quercetin dioxygenase-like cupin family protein